MPSSLLRPEQERRSNATHTRAFPIAANPAVNCCPGAARVARPPGGTSIRRALAAAVAGVVRRTGITRDARDRVTLIVALCVSSPRSHHARRSRNVPVVVVAGWVATSVALGLSSYWHCHDSTHPAFFQPLIWTVSLVKGGVNDFTLNKQICPSPTPEALWLGRLTALGAIFTGLASVVIALFRSQADRVRASLANSVTAVIGIDDETRSMISAIASTLDRSSTLVLVIGAPDEPGVPETRIHGGRVISVDFNAANSLTSLSVAQPRAPLPHGGRPADQSVTAGLDYARWRSSVTGSGCRSPCASTIRGRPRRGEPSSSVDRTPDGRPTPSANTKSPRAGCSKALSQPPRLSMYSSTVRRN
jgi:hypothetical protein